MADFNQAIEKIILDEVGNSKNGGYVNDPRDRGGETKWGISKRAHPNVDIKNLTREGAKDIYFNEYWGKIGGINDQDIAEVVFEITVMSNHKKAAKILQQAANKCGAKLAVDGILGEQTIRAANVLHPKWLLAELKLLEIENFARIVTKNSTQRGFLLGWVNRGLT